MAPERDGEREKERERELWGYREKRQWGRE
jgi:hypothetical protein